MSRKFLTYNIYITYIFLSKKNYEKRITLYLEIINKLNNYYYRTNKSK